LALKIAGKAGVAQIFSFKRDGVTMLLVGEQRAMSLSVTQLAVVGRAGMTSVIMVCA
jgi:hypothetical protein